MARKAETDNKKDLPPSAENGRTSKDVSVISRKPSICILIFSYVLIEQPVLRAAPQQPAVGKERQPGFQIPFRIQLFYHDRIPGEKGQKRDIVLPAHFVA